MRNFIRSLGARYERSTYAGIAQDFKEVTGKDIILDQETLVTNLTGGNVTYYVMGGRGCALQKNADLCI